MARFQYLKAWAFALIATACWLASSPGTSVAESPQNGPAAPSMLTWSDATGRFSTQAVFLGADAAMVRLRKANGVEICVGLDRLCENDRKVVKQLSANRSSGAAGPVWHTVQKAVTSLAEAVPQAITDPRLGQALDAAADEVRPYITTDDGAAPKNIAQIRLTHELVRRAVARQIDHQQPVVDVILGAQVRGDSRTVGRVDYDLDRDDAQSAGLLRFRGATSYSSVGYAGPVQVFTSGVTQFESVKRIWLDSSGIHTTPAATSAQTSSTITGVTSSLPRLRGRIATRIGSQRAAETKSQVEQITADHTRAQIEREFNDQADNQLADLWQRGQQQIAALQIDSRGGSLQINVRNTPDAVLITVTRSGQAADVPPAPFSAEQGVAAEAHIHAAFLKNFLASAAALTAARNSTAALLGPDSSSTLGSPKIRWSQDGAWLTLVWPSSAAGPEPVDRPPAIVASR